MEGQPRIEELLNKITFLRKALEFYSENKSYACTQGGPSAVDNDRGHQARFALEQTKEIEEYNQSLIEEYKKAISEEKERGEQKAFDMVVKVNKLMLDLGKK